MSKVRIQKVIADSGYCSRRKAEKLIEQQRVKVNNSLSKLGDHCFYDDLITIDDKQLNNNLPENIYLIINKPKNVVTTNKDEFGRKTVFDILPTKFKKYRLFSVGRLDKDTTGLLILTNDGNFAQSIIHPSKKISKIYIATLNKKLEKKDKNTLEKGITLNSIKLAPCSINEISPKKYEVILSEGRKRQIRRMFEKIGYNVDNLHRIQIGNLPLKNLKEGEIKEVSKQTLNDTVFAHQDQDTL